MSGRQASHVFADSVRLIGEIQQIPHLLDRKPELAADYRVQHCINEGRTMPDCGCHGGQASTRTERRIIGIALGSARLEYDHVLDRSDGRVDCGLQCAACRCARYVSRRRWLRYRACSYRPHRGVQNADYGRGEVHLRASWIFTRANVIANLVVILAALLVKITQSRIPQIPPAHNAPELSGIRWTAKRPLAHELADLCGFRRCSVDIGGGEGGIRTHVPELPDHPISSRRRYDHFGTSPVNLKRCANLLIFHGVNLSIVAV
jgi:hypothetical protein